MAMESEGEKRTAMKLLLQGRIGDKSMEEDKDKENCMTCNTVKRCDNEVQIDLMYPPYVDEKDNPNAKYITINLCAVRAADGIRIHFNYERNGWVIEQPNDNKVGGWEEVTFLEPWKYDKQI